MNMITQEYTKSALNNFMMNISRKNRKFKWEIKC